MGTSRANRKGVTDDTSTSGKAIDSLGTDSTDISRAIEEKRNEYNKQNGCQSLLRFAQRVDGWLRIAPDGEMKTVFIKFKWTRGVFSNCYVMVHCTYDQIFWGLDLLERKVLEVEDGVRRPVIDSFYQQT